MRAILPLLALSALFAGCVIDVPDDHYDGHDHYYEPADATAAFTWEFYPGLSCYAAGVDTVTVVLEDLTYGVVEEFTDDCYSATMEIGGLDPGAYHVEAFGEPSGWWSAYDVTLYSGYNDIVLRLR